jgi:hypothetical protein
MVIVREGIVVSYIGGCLCEALRYKVEEEPIDTGYCHCRSCQRSAGAPVLAWATFPIRAFTYIKGKPSVYLSSTQSQREFCGICGTQIAFRKVENAITIDVTIASLDDPAMLKPEYHIWTQSQISWFDTVDQLSRHQDAGPDIW